MEKKDFFCSDYSWNRNELENGKWVLNQERNSHETFKKFKDGGVRVAVLEKNGLSSEIIVEKELRMLFCDKRGGLDVDGAKALVGKMFAWFEGQEDRVFSCRDMLDYLEDSRIRPVECLEHLKKDMKLPEEVRKFDWLEKIDVWSWKKENLTKQWEGERVYLISGRKKESMEYMLLRGLYNLGQVKFVDGFRIGGEATEREAKVFLRQFDKWQHNFDCIEKNKKKNLTAGKKVKVKM